VAGAGLLGGAGLVPGLGGLSSLAGGLTGGLGGLGSIAGGLGGLGGIAGGLGGLGGIAGGLGGLGGIAGGLGGLGNLANIPGLDGIGNLAQSFGALGTDLIPDLSGSMSGIVDQVKGEFGGIISQAQNICGDAVKGALGDIGGSFTGAMDTNLLSKLGLENISFPGGNLLDNVVQQSQSFLTNGMPGLTECIATAKGFCDQSAFALGSITNALNPQMGRLNLENTFGQLTGGMVNSVLNPITNLNKTLTSAISGSLPNPVGFLGTLQSSINQSNQVFGSLAKDMTQWGSLFPKDVNNFYSPLRIAENLVSKNIPSFNNLLKTNGINPLNVGSASLSQMKTIFANAPVKVVSDVVAKTNFQKPINNLAEVLEPAKVLSSTSLESFRDFAGVAQQVASIGPTNSTSFAELGQSLSQVEFPRASTYINIEKDRSKLRDALNLNVDKREKITGSGRGVFGNPTMDDVMGSFTGTDYNIRLAGMLQAQRKLLASPTGVAFKKAIDSAIENAQLNRDSDAADSAAIRSAYSSLVNDTTNKEIIEIMNNFYTEIQDKLILEKRNLQAARLRPADAQGSLASITSFIQSLETAYQDDFQTGFKDWVDAAADTSLYGEAIRASMVQGRNDAIARSLGLDTTTISIVDYTDEEAIRKAIVLSKCCPPYSQNFDDSPADGTLLSTYCDNNHLYGIYSDGFGLSYAKIIEENSPSCGYKAPTTTTTSTSSTSTTSTSTSTTSTSTTSTSTTSTSTTSTSTTTTTAAPIYSLVNDTVGNIANEGSTITFTLNTTGLAPGTVIPWTITGVQESDIDTVI